MKQKIQYGSVILKQAFLGICRGYGIQRVRGNITRCCLLAGSSHPSLPIRSSNIRKDAQKQEVHIRFPVISLNGVERSITNESVHHCNVEDTAGLRQEGSKQEDLRFPHLNVQCRCL
ncbi:uncharacterized protein LOC117040643 isoform X2 [Lacerta agilis]|uniref:uncharacterized protein LOC117040643 isoform X2 n=1 Tax=Lacerta agilis TaxID=80427 RepID=UPI001419E6DF|nr:uncharacterized protein LOC117040643 isoform X2 [Lacerta agilis]